MLSCHFLLHLVQLAQGDGRSAKSTRTNATLPPSLVNCALKVTQLFGANVVVRFSHMLFAKDIVLMFYMFRCTKCLFYMFRCTKFFP